MCRKYRLHIFFNSQLIHVIDAKQDAGTGTFGKIGGERKGKNITQMQEPAGSRGQPGKNTGWIFTDTMIACQYK